MIRIKKFEGNEIHGFLNINVEFNSDLTFLIGINGSGKTTILQCITSILIPSIGELAAIRFKEIALTILVDKKVRVIKAQRKNDSLSISCSHIEKQVTFLDYKPDPLVPPTRDQEQYLKYYRDITREKVNNPVIKFLNSLEVPITLGIGRKHSDPRRLHTHRNITRLYT